MHKGLNCIVPIYNENERVIEVLKVLQKVKEISKTICVDDGSSDNSFKSIKNNFPEITIIKHEVNKGKAEAIQTGLQVVESDDVLLIDSDLSGLDNVELSEAINTYYKENLDCLILSSAPRNLFDTYSRRFFRILLCMAGNRLIRTNILREILKGTSVKGYELEIAQNLYLMKKNSNVAHTDISAVNPSKVGKTSLWNGLISESKMWVQIIAYLGPKQFVKMSSQFAEKQL